MCIIIILLLAIRMQVMIVYVWVHCLISFAFVFTFDRPSLFYRSVGRIILSVVICADCFMSPFNFTPYCEEVSDSFLCS